VVGGLQSGAFGEDWYVLLPSLLGHCQATPRPTAKTIAALLVTMVLAGFSRPGEAASCESLASLSLPNATITLAQSVPAGTFTLPNDPNGFQRGRGSASEIPDLPPFCRVAATLAPSPDSSVKIEVWLPLASWNGKFMAVGNGGFSGAIPLFAMGPMLKRGYAVAATDTGHQSNGGDASWALGHPEKQIDFGYRAVHEMTLRAKQLVSAFYATAPRFAYWNGCSSGGKQGLKEAQQFPQDYDGIIAGAPANYWTHLMAQILSVAQAVRKDPASQIPPTKYAAIHSAVLAQCDALDGVTDGLLEDPRTCRFESQVLRCKGADDPGCLTAPQLEALKVVYAPVKNSRTGRTIYPGLSVGSEVGWGDLPQPLRIAESHFKYVVFGNPDWDFRAFDVDLDLAKADDIDQTLGQFVANNPDLSAFKKRGGKLLQYHGWNDQQIAAQNSIDYYESVVVHMGGKAQVDDFYRLFMVPGMMHCVGGGGATDRFDTVVALEQWVERGVAPSRIIASHQTSGSTDRTRPLCPYPQTAQWKGSGSTDAEENFECAVRSPLASPAR
jgi:feruloyl esterase